MLTKIINGNENQMSPEEESQIRDEWAANDAAKAADEIANGYKTRRVSEYPAISDQIDSIYKALLHLQDNGTDIGMVGSEWLESIRAIKEKYPKPQ
jgi:thymidylate synthase